MCYEIFQLALDCFKYQILIFVLQMKTNLGAGEICVPLTFAHPPGLCCLNFHHICSSLIQQEFFPYNICSYILHQARCTEIKETEFSWKKGILQSLNILFGSKWNNSVMETFNGISSLVFNIGYSNLPLLISMCASMHRKNYITQSLKTVIPIPRIYFRRAHYGVPFTNGVQKLS